MRETLTFSHATTALTLMRVAHSANSSSEIRSQPPTPRRRRSSATSPRRIKKAPIIYTTFLVCLRKLLGSIVNVDPLKYGTHSLRIGGATALLAAGCPAYVIQAMGRWSSDVYKLYCRSNTIDLLHWQRALGRQSVNPTETVEDCYAVKPFPSRSSRPNLRHDDPTPTTTSQPTTTPTMSTATTNDLTRLGFFLPRPHTTSSGSLGLGFLGCRGQHHGGGRPFGLSHLTLFLSSTSSLFSSVTGAQRRKEGGSKAAGRTLHNLFSSRRRVFLSCPVKRTIFLVTPTSTR